MRRAQRLAPWGKLLGLAPLGRGQGGGVAGPDRFGDPPYYLLNDTFTANRAGGAVNGTDAETGPGRRQVTDTGNTESITGSRLTVVNSAGTRDPNHIYACGYALGRVMVAEVTPGGTGNNARVGFGWTTSSNLLDAGLRFATGGALAPSRSPGAGPNVATFSSATSYRVAVVMLLDGALFFIKGGAYTNWTLLWIERNYVVALDTFRVGIQAIAAAQSYTSDYIRVPADKWLPAPLVSDGFSVWGTSDGLGHAEGVAGGLGSGGSGLAYSTVGTWQASGGVASASALSSGSAIAYVNAGKADVIATVEVTRSGGDGGLLLRFVDGNNFISCRHDGTNVILVKKVSGSNTTVQTTAATYVAGAELRVICEGTKFRVFYNGVAVGTEQTISDAALQSGTRHGLYTTNTGNTFDDLVIRVRGAGGEYAALDAF